MRFHDKTVLSSGCNTLTAGQIADLEAVPFELHVHRIKPVRRLIVEIFGVFGFVDKNGERTDLVETGLVTATASSSIVRKTARLVGLNDIPRQASSTVLSSDNTFVEQLRTRFCERVAECPGVVNGECWALGEPALRQAIEEIPLET